MNQGGSTAFVRSAGDLARQLREAAVDHAAFQRPLRRCALARCRASCCHDGVVVGTEEEMVIRELVEAKRRPLAGYGWSEPGLGAIEEPDGDRATAGFVDSDDGKRRTATRPAETAELADDFPAQFKRSRCVFLDREHRCVLQRLADDEDRHPWFWKPISCWMHPLLLRAGDRPVLTLPDPADDPEGFVCCTHCGRTEQDGEPAAVVLIEELEMLRAISGRDFARELG